ncbi:hypothetical protein BDW66DRAFT_140739 [Aspergillus desertorum]
MSFWPLRIVLGHTGVVLVCLKTSRLGCLSIMRRILATNPVRNDLRLQLRMPFGVVFNDALWDPSLSTMLCSITRSISLKSGRRRDNYLGADRLSSWHVTCARF